MKGSIDKIITEYMTKFCPDNGQLPPVPGELTFDLLEAFTDQEHIPVKLKVKETPDKVLYAKEGSLEEMEGGYWLPEMHTVWQKYLAHRDDALDVETARLQKEMLLVISREFLTGAGVDTYRSFTSLAAAGRYYMEQLSALPGSEAAELKEALEILKH